MPPKKGGDRAEADLQARLNAIPLKEHRNVAKAWVTVRRQTDKVSAHTARNAAQTLLALSLWLKRERDGKPFEAVTRHDVRQFVADLTKPVASGGMGNMGTTAAARQIQLKLFYKWMSNPDEYERGKKVRRKMDDHPATEWIEVTRKDTTRRLSAEKILTRNEVFQLIDACTSDRDKALVATLWDAGFRVGAMVALNVGSYRRITERTGQLVIPVEAEGTKTGTHRVILVDAVQYIEALRRNHPLAEYPDAPLFYSQNTSYYLRLRQRVAKERTARAAHQPIENALRADDFDDLRLTDDGIRSFLRRLMVRAGIRKHVHPHLFRHSRATYFASKNVPEPVLRARFGWQDDSRMPSIYVNLSGAQIDAAVLKAQGLDVEDDAESELVLYEPWNCRCGHLNDPVARFCGSCGIPRSPDALLSSETTVGVSQLGMLEQNPELAEQLLDMLLQRLEARDAAAPRAPDKKRRA